MSTRDAIVLPDGSTVRLGRKPPDRQRMRRAIRLADYFDPARMMVAPPDTLDLSSKAADVIAKMYLNDTYGDCVIASLGHVTGIWHAYEYGQSLIAQDSEIRSAYSTICGPGDNGCNIQQVLDYRKATGITLGGQVHKIDGYAAVDWSNQLLVKVAMNLFGPLTLGINLPSAWANGADIWDVTNSSIVGGHDVPSLGYDAQYVPIATWASKRRITWAAFMAKDHIEECWCCLSLDWYGNNNLSPMGIDVATLQADLAAIGGGTVPPWNPTPTPTPPPPPTPTPTPGGGDAPWD